VLFPLLIQALSPQLVVLVEASAFQPLVQVLFPQQAALVEA
jgi:hypothetical protein